VILMTFGRLKQGPKVRIMASNFIKMMKEAKRRGKTTFRVQGAERGKLMEHILRDKLGFKQMKNETWIKIVK